MTLPTTLTQGKALLQEDKGAEGSEAASALGFGVALGAADWLS